MFIYRSHLHTNFIIDDGAELYKNDRLLDLVTFTDTLVATPLSWAIQDPHVKFQEICKEQNLDAPKNVLKPLERKINLSWF